MNLSMFKPLKNGIFPFPPLDGPPQRLEGARLATAVQLPDGKEAVYAGCDLEPMFLRAAGRVSLSAEAVWDGDLSSSFVASLQCNLWP